MRKIRNTLWGQLTAEEAKKFSFLAVAIFFLIGSYWPLKVLKESVFINVVGVGYEPYVKMISPFFLLPLVLFYTSIINYVSKERLIFLFTGLFTTLGILFSILLAHPTIGLANSIPSPYRLVGWLFFLFTECFVALMYPLFWSFIHDITPPESAKRGYGLIFAASQFGALVFLLLSGYIASDTSAYAQNTPILTFGASMLFVAFALTIWVFRKVVNPASVKGYETKKAHKSPTKFLDGLSAIFTRPYVMGIFLIIFFHEVVVSLFNYQLNVLVTRTFSCPGMRHLYLNKYAILIQVVSILFALIGTSFFQRKFGIRFCLLAFPALLGGLALAYTFTQTLFVITGIMILAKGLNYAFFQPSKEILYIPTSVAIKYKAKGWIDMFGMRFSKSVGGLANKFVGMGVYLVGPLALGLVGVWCWVSFLTGSKYNKTVKAKATID